MVRLSGRYRAGGVTLALVILAAVEVWALSPPMLRDLEIDLLGQRSARDVGIALDLLLVVLVALLVLAFAWRKPAWIHQRLQPLLRNHQRSVKRSLPWLLLPIAYVALRALPVSPGIMFVIIGVIEVGFIVLLGFRLIRISCAVSKYRQSGYSFTTALQ